MMAAMNVVIMAGGTGGHVFPGLAVAEVLAQRGCSIHWLGTRSGIEAVKVPQAGIKISYLGVTGIRGKRGWALLKAPFLLLLAIFQALRALRTLRPVVVLGMGGFVAGPGGVAAKLLGVPIVIHEQNAVAGTTNRILSRVATKVLEGFAGAFRGRAEYTGNPVRQDIRQLDRSTRDSGSRRVLVVGGSLGARPLNQVIPAALTVMRDVEVIHQCGKGNSAEVASSYGDNANVRVVEFIDDMAQSYQWADIIICRSGAMTVAEVSQAGLPAIFIPLPHAIDDHQTANAVWLVEDDAAVLLPQTELTAEAITGRVTNMLADTQGLIEMGCRAKAKSVGDSAQDIADICLEVAHG